MADRIAVFNHGQLIQVATPDEIYHRPNSRFVADFVGSSNLLPPAWVQARRGQAVWASLRPEAIRLVETGGSPARVTGASFLGAGTRVQVLMDDLPLQVLLPGNVAVPAPDSIVRIDWPAEQLHLMTAD
ncbi:MAG: TOBE domain-containing protein [Burkholderiaceae bacterium]